MENILTGMLEDDLVILTSIEKDLHENLEVSDVAQTHELFKDNDYGNNK